MSANTLATEALSYTGAIPKPPSQDSVLAALTKYIPTEFITLYVAAVSAQTALMQLNPMFSPHFCFWFFTAFTPVLLLLLFLRQARVSGALPIPVKNWPWWKMCASVVAFFVWGMAVPGNPIIPVDNATGGVIAGFAAIFVSTFLNLLSPFFEKEI